MRLREVLVATLLAGAGCGSVSDNGNNIDAAIDAPDTTAPMILSSHPAKNEKKASVIAPISILFDEALDPASVTAATVTVHYANKVTFYEALGFATFDNAGIVLTGTVTYDAAMHKIVFKPLTPLPYNSHIDVTLDGVKDVAGNAVTAAHLVFDTLANYDRFWTYYSFTGQISNYIDFGEMGGLQSRYTFATAPGADQLWFSSDDQLQARYSIAYDATNRMTSAGQYSPGTDGKYFTSDDVQSQNYVTKYDATDHFIELASYSNAGADMMWGTADDLVSNYYQVTWQGDHYIGSIYYSNPGLDGIWRTADDKTFQQFVKNQYDMMGHRSRSIRYAPGTDQLPNTADDVISGYEDLTTDARGRVIRDVFRTSGPDAIWFNVDDGYNSYTQVVLDARDLPVQMQTFTGPGADNMWLTADDQMNGLIITTYNQNGQATEIDRMGAGADNKLGTADDVIQGLTITTYDANGARSTQTMYNPGPDGNFKTADDTKSELMTFDTSN